ncbi:hypothetical protein Scep_024018 [Stephania cephalantha]|uniref:DYW domain-containing protein n=1 Tax=Stephania cephalantha TaxID=152367 RepID=A0AAP0HTB2_9MAGN
MVVLSRHWGKTIFPISSRHSHSQPHQNHRIIPQLNLTFNNREQQRTLLESQLVSLLDGCTHLAQLNQLHAHLFRRGLNQCSLLVAKLLRILTALNVPVHAYPRRLFDQVHNPNAFAYTALIRGYSLLGPFEESVVLYTQMRREGVRPLSFTFSALFKACSGALDVELGRQIHAQTVFIGGYESDLFVGNTLIDMYVKCGALDCGRRVFDEMPERDVISWTSLIVAYTKSGDMDAAGELFDGLPDKDMVAWTAMITGYAQNARPREALSLFESMREAGLKTDEVTLVGVISACAQLGAAKYAGWIRETCEKEGLSPNMNVVIGSALIDMHSKCGSVEEAYLIFKDMTVHNVFSYTAMILGFAMHGLADSAIKLFYEMTETEIKPNKVTFIGVLTACSHAGMIREGQRLFTKMQDEYGVTPEADHYTCMADLLGRAGHLEEALELINSMPLEPHGGVWGALLGACRIHGNSDIAELAANHLFKLEPNSIGNYLLLSNIYALVGRWSDVSKVRNLIRSRGLKKNPGCSWVEAKDGVVHEFFAGDMRHPKSKEIKDALDELLKKLKVDGYKPILSSVVYDMSDIEKERRLKSHSEKLALAFSLLTTSSDSPIMIMKNLRICEDCHIVMCGASRVMKREISVRDNMRFHHFRDGACSCGNFW